MEMRWLGGITDAVNMNLGKLRPAAASPACCGKSVARSRTRLGDRTAMVISHAAAVRNPKSACIASPEHPPRVML